MSGDGETDAVCRSSSLGILLSLRAERALRDGESVKPDKIKARLPAGIFKIKHSIKQAVLHTRSKGYRSFAMKTNCLFRDQSLRGT